MSSTSMIMSLLSEGAGWDPHSHLGRPSLSVGMGWEKNRRGGDQQRSLDAKQIPLTGL